MIGKVGSSGLCTGCGTCAGICRVDAIEMQRNCEGLIMPTVNEVKCTQCENCERVCPGISFDLVEVRRRLFGNRFRNPLLGSFTNCYLGYSLDRKIRWEASSGGLLTSLLIFGLDEGVFDGALVTKMSGSNPLEPEAFIAKTKEELIASVGSKYLPNPANCALKEILKNEGKFAVVGLPCHIQGIRKAELFNKKLARKIVLHLGLFCGHTTNFLGTEFLLSRIGVKKEEVKDLSYRGRGWPGEMSICLRNGKEIFVPHDKYYPPFALNFFTPLRCMLCQDVTAEMADLSFGDPWLPELRSENVGKSIVVSRTTLGEEILKDAALKGRIKYSGLGYEKVIESQRGQIFLKKRSHQAFISIARLFNRKLNEKSIETPLFDSGPQEYTIALVYYINSLFSSKFNSALNCLPLPAFDLYNRGAISAFSILSKIRKHLRLKSENSIEE